MFLSELGNAIKKKMINDFADIEVLYFKPGRIRIYARQVHHNRANTKVLVNYLTNMKEIKNFSVNPHTGSVLIEYLPEDIAGNKFLQELEDSLRKKHGRR